MGFGSLVVIIGILILSFSGKESKKQKEEAPQRDLTKLLKEETELKEQEINREQLLEEERLLQNR
jgi:hypothetical protein